jgi:hypothetical protein
MQFTVLLSCTASVLTLVWPRAVIRQLCCRHELHHQWWPHDHLQIALAQEVRVDLQAFLSACQQRSAAEAIENAYVCARERSCLHLVCATIVDMHANAPSTTFVVAG